MLIGLLFVLVDAFGLPQARAQKLHGSFCFAQNLGKWLAQKLFLHRHLSQAVPDGLSFHCSHNN